MKMPNVLNIKNFHNTRDTASHSKLIIDNFMRRYAAFIAKDIKITGIYKDGSSYVFTLSIPSEKNHKYKSNIFYDIIIEFYPNKETVDDKKIVEYNMRVFSNCPTFTFIFTHVYYKMGVLYKKIPISKYSERALTDPANVTNAHRLIGIEKSIFYSIRKIYHETSYNKDKIDKMLTVVGKDFKFPGTIFNNIVSQSSKIKEINDVEKKKIPRRGKASNTTIHVASGNRSIASAERRKTDSSNSNNLSANLNSNMSNGSLKSSSGSSLKSNSFSSNLKE